MQFLKMSREKKYTQPRFYFGAHSQLENYFKEILHTQKCINNDNIKVCRYIDFNVKRSSSICCYGYLLKANTILRRVTNL